MYEAGYCSCMSEIQRFISKPASSKTKLLEKKICAGSRSPPHLLGQIYLQASELDQTDKLFIHSFPFFSFCSPQDTNMTSCNGMPQRLNKTASYLFIQFVDSLSNADTVKSCSWWRPNCWSSENGI